MKNVLEIKITLEGTKPPVWRRVVVPEKISLYELHHTLQIVFGWQNYHMYSFMLDDLTFGNADLLEDSDVIDDKKVFLTSILKKGSPIQYEYDFGDSWLHSIKLEKTSPIDTEIITPVCIDGAMACPPEDCGGVSGYKNLVEVMKSSKHPEYNDFVEWLGKPFDSEYFNLQSINKEIKKIKAHIKEYETNLR